MARFKVGDKVRISGGVYTIGKVIQMYEDSNPEYILEEDSSGYYFDSEPGPAEESEAVEAPSHYTDGGIETIDYIRAKLTAEEFTGYCKGNALKYISRAGKKGDWLEDIKKAIKYLRWLI